MTARPKVRPRRPQPAKLALFARDIPAAAVAADAGVSRSMASLALNGRVPPGRRLLDALVARLGIPAHELFDADLLAAVGRKGRAAPGTTSGTATHDTTTAADANRHAGEPTLEY